MNRPYFLFLTIFLFVYPSYGNDAPVWDVRWSPFCEGLERESWKCPGVIEKTELPSIKPAYRHGDILFIKLKNGKQEQFHNENGREVSTAYSLLHYFEDLGLFMIDKAISEGGSTIFLDDRDGHTFELNGRVRFSPDGKRLLSVFSWDGDGEVSIWSVSQYQINQEWGPIRSMDLGKEIGEAKWINNSKVQISSYDEKSSFTFLSLKNANWIVSEK